MVKNADGLSRDLIIHPGETLKEALFDRGMTQKELASRVAMTEQHVSRVVRGTTGISGAFAKKLEYVLDIPASFWMNLQKIYDLELADYEDRHNISNEEYAIASKISPVLAELLPLKNQEPEADKRFAVVQARKTFRVASLELLSMPAISAAYRASKAVAVDEHMAYAWNKLCDAYLEKIQIETRFEKDTLISYIPEIKALLLAKDIAKAILELQRLFQGIGIRFAVVTHYKGAPHHGRAYLHPEGFVDICITIRGSRLDIFWFSLFHEIARVLNGDLAKKEYSQEDEDKADRLAAALLIPAEPYKRFVETRQFALDDIKAFAKEIEVPDSIVIGRLQKDGFIRWSRHTDKVPRLKWKKKPLR